MSGANGVLDEIDLPYLQILDLQPTGSSPAVNEEKNQDITAMSYSITFAIRDSAWPATT
jgi:hypothetical protein